MIHAWILVSLFMQAQTAQPTVPPEVLTLLQSGVDAENRRDLDQAIAAFRQAANRPLPLALSFSGWVTPT
jgi:hypothetical protein